MALTFPVTHSLHLLPSVGKISRVVKSHFLFGSVGDLWVVAVGVQGQWPVDEIYCSQHTIIVQSCRSCAKAEKTHDQGIPCRDSSASGRDIPRLWSDTIPIVCW